MSQPTEFIPFAKPSLGPEEEDAVLRVMRSGWLTTGAETLAFEKEFAAYVGAGKALAVNSATSGLHLALEALGVGPGDNIITSPYTFTSTAAVVRHLGAEVRFCDTAPGSYNMDVDALERALKTTKNCKAVIAVHIGGLPCDMDALVPLARRYGCAVVEDAAHAFPSRTSKGFAGTLGDIGVYSFYATKTITTGEGGMIVCKDPALAARMGLMRMHGIDREVWNRYTAPGASWAYRVSEAGYKYNLPDILSAMGRVQLSKAAGFLDERRAIAKHYDAALGGCKGAVLPPRNPLEPDSHAWHLYTLKLGSESAVKRDRFVERMSAAGIGCSVHFIPLHIMPYYAERYGLSPESFPNALASYEATVSLPIWQGMGMQRAQRCAEAAMAALAPEGQ